MHRQGEHALPMTGPWAVSDSEMSQVASEHAAPHLSTVPSSAVGNAFPSALSICRRARPERHFRTYSRVLTKNMTTELFHDCNSHPVSCRKQRCSGEVGVKLRFTPALPACQGSGRHPFGPLSLSIFPLNYSVYTALYCHVGSRVL